MVAALVPPFRGVDSEPVCARGDARLDRLNLVLDALWRSNQFQRERWERTGLRPGPLSSLEDLAAFPLTTRVDFEEDQRLHPPLGTNLTAERSTYRRVHRTSGTTRAPLVWPDTTASWRRLLELSEALHRMAGITAEDRIFFALPFGATMGSWVVFEGAFRLGCALQPGGLETPDEERRWLLASRPTVIVGSRPRVLTLAASLRGVGIDPASLKTRKIIQAGDPKTDDPSARQATARAWGAELFVRYGLTEAGSVAGECTAHSGGLHVLDEGFIAEVVRPETGEPLRGGGEGELVLTSLSRLESPIVRYRTGDLVRLVPRYTCRCGRTGTFLEGGVHRARFRAPEPCSRSACEGED